MRLSSRGHGSRTQNGPRTWSSWSAICLLLGVAVAGADKTAADYYVHSLPGAPDGPLLKMHAGHVEVDPDHNGNLFFWHYQNRHIGDRQRTVIWLNGGPGCSSMDGALMEIGPYRLKDDAHLEYNAGSWDEFANVLFVDNPVGTGFSYVDTNSYIHELPEMASQFMVFLEKWFAMFPEYEHDDIYIAGESYAGQHIPYISRAILDRNEKIGQPNDFTNNVAWNLKGLLIGNGWIDPIPQYQAYLQFAYAEGLVQGGSEIAQQLERTQATCLTTINSPGGTNRVDLPECEETLQDILRLTQTSDHKCYNMYDVRLKDDYPSCGMAWPPDLTSVTPYLRRQDVIGALHINKDKRTGWTECSGAVSSAFRARNSEPSIKLLPGILEAGVPITLFSGAKDLICNHFGTEGLISSMSWNGATGFETSPGVWAPKRDWTFEGEAAGIYQEARNLSYVLFYNSSHMVPFDYPRRTRDMLDRFIGVDIASIGGTPADSRIDGEKAGLETSVGGHPNSTLAEEEEAKKLQDAEYKAYYRSGEAVLVFVAIAAALWGTCIWRARRASRKGYQGVGQGNGALSLEAFTRKHTIGGKKRDGYRGLQTGNGDLEAADFDEAELDEMPSAVTGREAERYEEAERFAMAEDSDDEDFKDAKKGKDRSGG